MLNMVRAVGEEHLAVAEIAAQHADLVVGAEGRSEQPIGVQALQPLAVEPIGFRSSGGALGLTRVDQEDLQAARLQEFKHGNPVDPVDSIATVVMPQSRSQSARASRSA